jgi:prophage maintenance system killer protein
MAAIPWTQAFFDGNRRTGIIAAGTFLRDNGYELDISTEEENAELRKMLRSRNINVTLNQPL